MEDQGVLLAGAALLAGSAIVVGSGLFLLWRERGSKSKELPAD